MMNPVRYIFGCFAMLLCFDTVAQQLNAELTDTFYYDDKWEHTDAEKAIVYRPPVVKEGNTYKVKYYYSNHNLFYEGVVKPGYVKDNPSIEPLVAIHHGIFTYYDIKGVKTSEEYFVDGNARGEWREYYKGSGSLKSIRYYDSIKAEQYVIFYHENGIARQSEGLMTGIMKGGKMQYKREGKWIYYNNEVDNTSAIVTFSAGEKDGKVQFYDSLTGNLILKGKYSLNMKSGEWTYYNAKTKKRTAIINFDRGEPHGELFVFYPETGNLKQTGVYNHGKRNGLWSGLYDCEDRRIQWQADYKKDRAKIIYYDSANNDREIRVGNLYVYQRVGLWLEYHADNGRLKSKETYNNNLLEGVAVTYDKSGMITSEVEYSHGMKNGKSTYYFDGTNDVWSTAIYYDDDVQKLQIYYPSGKTKRVVDELKIGDNRSICYGLNGDKENCDPLRTDAQFNGDVLTYIGDNLKYPEEARLMRMEGKVKVGFTVNEDGSIKNPYIIEGFDSRCDEEALRLVSQMPAWVPASIDDTPVATNKILPIVFVVNSADMHAQSYIEKDAFSSIRN